MIIRHRSNTSLQFRAPTLVCAVALASACSGSDSTTGQGSGGAVNFGGSTASATGGDNGSGGSASSASSGVVPSGGTSLGLSSQQTGVGGALRSGGAAATGGKASVGGTTANLASTTGSRLATGGAIATGGTRSVTGGTQAAGGTTVSGGSAGNSASTAGGGTKSTAGTTASGGSAMAGSGTGTGGSSWPQCFSNDTVPTTELKQRAPTADYETQVAYGGVAMIIGPSRQSCLTDAVVNFDVKDLDGEIKDIVETLQFPGFLDWKRGYYLNWVILNSGVPNATLSGQGGHQGDRYGHMNFESTEECPCNWGTGDSSNRGNALHESIHALQAELWAFNNQASGWIHEAHNCYLGTQRAHIVENKYTMGWGAALALQMPHVPIESMGLLTDDTVAGPSDQLASGKSYVNSIVRYGLEIFFLSLNLEMGRGFINCMWLDASKAGNPDQRRSGTLSVFQSLQSYAGAEGAAHAVQSFGARSSLLDFGGWTAVVRTTLQGNWNNAYWFYTYPSGDGTSTFRPPTKQVPHHQGRNIIPIKVAAGATSVAVEFTPDAAGSKGTTEHMQAQLTYRNSSDQPVYGGVFSSGQNTISISDGVRNGIVNLVVAVTNPNASSGGDDGSGKGFDGQEHFNYQARIVSGGTIAPNTTRPW